MHDKPIEQDHHGHDHRPLMKVDLPTHEQPSGSREGVGSLPGPNTASGVAILPDERTHGHCPKSDDKSHLGHDHRPIFKVDMPLHEQPSGSREGVGSLPGPNNARGVAILPDERIQSHHHKTSDQGLKAGEKKYELPCSEVPSGSSVGIGSMPGTIWESGVATLPDERLNENVNAAQLDNAETLAALNPVPSPSKATAAGNSATENVAATTHPVRNIASHVEHAAEDVVGAVEGAAAGVYHSAEAMLHSIGSHWHGGEYGRAEPQEAQREAGPGAEKHGANPATGTPGSFLTSDAKAPHSGTARSAVLAAVDSGQPKAAGKVVFHEYERTVEYDLHGERLDVDQFVYEDDASAESDVAAAHVMLRRRKEADKASSGASSISGTSSPDNIRVQQAQGEGTAVGHGGVEFYTEGKSGVLPGYPTPKGMGVLIVDRINDDHLRAQSAPSRSDGEPTKRVQLRRGESTASNRAVDGSYTSLSTGEEDTSNEFHVIEERREVPIFQDGSESAIGRYEAIFEPVDTLPGETHHGGGHAAHQFSGQSQDVKEQPGHRGTTPTGQYPATAAPQIPSSQPFSNAPSAPQGMKAAPALQGSEGSAAAPPAPFNSDLPSPITGTSVFDQAGPHGHPQMHEQEATASFPGSGEKSQGPAVVQPELERWEGLTGGPEAANKPTPELHGPASYLGKPVSKAEEETQIEKARLLARKKAGVN